MAERSRTYNSITNSIFGIIASIITVALNFVVRVVLVRQLGDEINGINSLFQSIISVMALMEMGIGSAMVIHLYEPIKHKDEEMIAGIMSFYRQLYMGVAAAFAIICLLVSFFLLDKLVTSSIAIQNVRLYFLIFSAVSVANYLTYYKRSLLFAEQKSRIVAIVSALSEVIFRGLQIGVLILYQNYIIFLILLVFEKLVCNVVCAKYVDRYHPYLVHNRATINKDKKVAIFNTVRPLMVFQVANTLQSAACSILISLLLGNVSIVGYYGAYQLIVSVVILIFGQFGASYTTSFGNLAVENDKVHMQAVYKRANFIFNVIACLCACLFLACADDFVSFFFGEHFVLGYHITILITIQMLVSVCSTPIISIQNAMGLHRYDAMAMLIQSFVSIILGYVLGLLWGMAGILIGIILPMIVIMLIRKGLIISKTAMGMSSSDFISVLLSSLCFVTLGCVITIIAVHNINIGSFIGNMVVKGIIAFLLAIITIYVTSYRKEEFQYSIGLLKSFETKVLKK